ncbi:myo-inositol 2-dehydrogenase [Bifidobacterium callitrichos]|nr:myo-inositol 2-dehydrogenase [Bifidobacterium callitrichos]
MINVGFIGCGAMGRDHVRRITERCAGAQVIGVYDTVAANAQRAIDDNRLDATIYDSAEALIDDPKVDAIVIASRNDVHLDPLLRSIDLGKPTFTEKPMTINGSDSWKVVEAEVAKGRRTVQVGFNWRFDPGYDAMKRFTADGGIGTLLMAGMRHYNAQASTSYYGTDNVINDTLIHNFDMLHYMFDDDFTAIEMKFARMNSLNPNGESLREPQLAVVEFAGGALATAEANVNCQYGYDIQCRLVGESGIISLPDVATPEVRHAGQISHAISSAWFDRFTEAYDREFDRFFANVEADRQPGGVEATAWDGYVANVAADAALESLHHGGRVAVKLNDKPSLYDLG